MKLFTTLRIRSFLLIFFSICTIQVFAQAVDDYRTRQSGDWNDVNTWERWNGSSWQIPNASAFPVVSATATSTKSATAGTTHTVSLPAGIQSGDLLLIFWADADAVNTDPGTPLGWTQLYTTTINNRIFRAWYKIASGLEGTTLNITAGAERSAHTSYRISSGSYQGVPVAGTAVTGTNNAPNPPNLTSGFGATNTLWIAASHSGGDDNSPAPTAPTNYTAIITGYTGNSNTTHARVATARRELSAASENPGAFGLGSNVDWLANTVAIRSVPVTGTPTNLNGVITIRNGHTVTVTASVSADQCTIDAGGQVTVNAGQTLTVANGTGTDLTVNGTLVNSNTVTTTGTVVFNASSVYQHAQDGGVIPTATWNAASNCNVTGITGTVPSGLTQTFGNFTWNCAGQTTFINLNSALQTINGNFNVMQAGQFVSPNISNGLGLAGNSNLTLNVAGDVNVTNTTTATWFCVGAGSGTVIFNVTGNFNISGANTFLMFHFPNIGGSVLNQITANVTGNFSFADGYFDWASTTSAGTGQSTMNLGGNFTSTGTAFMTTSASSTSVISGKIVFNKVGLQTFSASTPANITYTNFTVDASSTLQLLSSIQLTSSTTANWAGKFIVNSNGILDAGTNQIVSSSGLSLGLNNDFTLNTGAGIITANVGGVHQIGFVGPTISAAIATRTFSSGANYTYNGTAVQTSGTFTTTPTANQVNNLTMNNTAGNTTTGVTLAQPFAVAGVLTLTSGHITTTSNLLTMNAGSSVAGANYFLRRPKFPIDDNSFVNGAMRKIGNTDFLFPVGKIMGGFNRGMRYCGVSSTLSGLATDAFNAEFISGSASNLSGGITASGLSHVSKCEYWNIARTNGSRSPDVTLSWSPSSICNAAAYVNQLSSLVVAHYGTSWDSFGNDGGNTGGVSAGSVTWNGVSTFSPFSLGSTSSSENPLPVKLINVKAYNTGGRNRIEWTNLTEIDVLAYEVERSLNGTQFTSMASLAARSNANDKESYYEYDVQPASVTYYRIKVKSRDGEIVYSPIVKVATNLTVKQDIVLYPNPVTGKQLTMQMNSTAGDYFVKIYSANGQIVKTETLKHPGGSYAKTIELPSQLQAGQYYMQVSGGEKILTSKFIVQ
ncbi:MAG: T9SS type A sorting domain-containing protein [Chitinophagaceae bacterium]|nr:T9SS type A sorting domain-containing protein [Chitinophagaceae bacterium]